MQAHHKDDIHSEWLLAEIRRKGQFVNDRTVWSVCQAWQSSATIMTTRIPLNTTVCPLPIVCDHARLGAETEWGYWYGRICACVLDFDHLQTRIIILDGEASAPPGELEREWLTSANGDNSIDPSKKYNLLRRIWTHRFDKKQSVPRIACGMKFLVLISCSTDLSIVCARSCVNIKLMGPNLTK